MKCKVLKDEKVAQGDTFEFIKDCSSQEACCQDCDNKSCNSGCWIFIDKERGSCEGCNYCEK
jgi:hypothetical protein